MLSILVYGRNDTHGYNLHKRVALSLNAIAVTLVDPTDEIVFVDYNTASDLPTFPEAIRDTLTDEALARLRVIRVPTWVHQERFADLTRLVALEPIARNVGLRRSNPANPWILSTNTDMLFVPRRPDGSLTEAVADLEDGYYALPRFDIPEALWESMDRRDPAKNLELLRDWGLGLHLDSIVLSYAYNGFDAPGDFQLVRRDRLIEIDGFDEEMLHGWHVDSNLFKRLSLVYGLPGDLSNELAGYHCDHTRLATAVHTTGGIQNDLKRFVEEVERPGLPDQTPAWGLADLELEEVDLRVGTARRFAAALARVTPPALPAAPVVDGLDAAELMHYEAAHVLPYLVDPLTVLPADSTIAYVGLNDELASMTAAFLRELGFTTPLQILDVEGAPRLDGTVTVPFGELTDSADAVIFDFGFPRPADGSEPPATMRAWPRDLRWRLGVVLDRFDELVSYDRAARGRPRRRRYLAVNSRSNIFEPFFTSRLVTTTTPFNTRTQHGFVADLTSAEIDSVMTPLVRNLLFMQFGYGLVEKGIDYEIGEEIDFTLAGDAHRFLYDGWSFPEDNGTWTDGEGADLFLDLHEADLTTKHGYLLTVDAAPFLVRPDHCHVSVEVSVNGTSVDTLDHACGVSAPTVRHLVVSDDVVARSRPLHVSLRIDEPARPIDLGVSIDARQLGVKVRSISLRPRELAIKLGERVRLGDPERRGDWLVSGWSRPELCGTWTDGAHAEIVVAPAGVAPDEPVDLAVEIRDALLSARHPTLAVDVTVDGVAVDRWTLGLEDPRHHIRRVPLRAAGTPGGRPVSIDLAIDSPARPVDLGNGADARLLGLMVASMSLVRADAPDPALLPARRAVSTLLDKARARIARVRTSSWFEPKVRSGRRG